MSTRKLFCLSDLHCGSEIGLCPPNFKMVDGSSRVLSHYQEWLWKCWERAIELMPEDALFVHLGDAVEGIHHRSVEVISGRVEDHLGAAVEALTPMIAKASKAFFVEGTECHTGDLEHALGKMVGAELDPNTNRYSWQQGLINFCGVDCLFMHHMPTTGKAHLEANALGMEKANVIYNRARAGLTIPKVIGFGHRHVGGWSSDGHTLSFVNGAWQGLTRWGRNKVGAAIPTPTVTILDWTDVPDGELPVVRYEIFKPIAPTYVQH